MHPFDDSYDRSEWIPVEVVIISRETEKAIQIRTEDNNMRGIWLPKSQVAEAEELEAGDQDLTIHVRRWLAEEIGLA